MTEQNDGIFSSTGTLGVTRRQDERLYVNGEYANNVVEVTANYVRLTTIAASFPGKISRSVYRGAVSEHVFRSIKDTKLTRDLEVALPLEEFTGENSWLVYLSRNHPGRRSIVSVDEMVRETNMQQEVKISPLERVIQTVDRDYRFTRNFTAGDISQIHELWSETFGWNEEQVANLQKRLDGEQALSPSQRSVWFSAVRDNGTIISLAMAEKLTIPAGNNKSLDLVESTEWRTRDNYSGQHLMTANLAMLNAQILSDMRMSPNGVPLIFAECNYQSRSDRAANGALLEVPSRRHAQQIIVQNVHVGDGASVENKYRDFTPLYLPVSSIESGYRNEQVDAMLQLVVNT